MDVEDSGSSRRTCGPTIYAFPYVPPVRLTSCSPVNKYTCRKVQMRLKACTHISDIVAAGFAPEARRDAGGGSWASRGAYPTRARSEPRRRPGGASTVSPFSLRLALQIFKYISDDLAPGLRNWVSSAPRSSAQQRHVLRRASAGFAGFTTPATRRPSDGRDSCEAPCFCFIGVGFRHCIVLQLLLLAVAKVAATSPSLYHFSPIDCFSSRDLFPFDRRGYVRRHKTQEDSGLRTYLVESGWACRLWRLQSSSAYTCSFGYLITRKRFLASGRLSVR